MNNERKFYEMVVEMQAELDYEYSEYQRLHRKFYLEDDINARIIYKQKTDLLQSILKRIEL